LSAASQALRTTRLLGTSFEWDVKRCDESNVKRAGEGAAATVAEKAR
jgi:hypothetical protein